MSAFAAMASSIMQSPAPCDNAKTEQQRRREKNERYYDTHREAFQLRRRLQRLRDVARKAGFIE